MSNSNEKRKIRYAERVAQGLCPRCGKVNPSKFKYCEECRADERARKSTYIKYGVCPRCRNEKLYGDEKLCLLCKVAKAEEGKAYWEKNHDELAAKRKVRRKELGEERKANGLCVTCGKENTDKRYVNCPSCREKASGYKKAQYLRNPERVRERNKNYKSHTVENRKANGLCVNCGKPAKEDRNCCEECLEKNRITAKNERLFRKKNNICQYCGKERTYLNESFCDVCIEKQRENCKRSYEKNKEKSKVRDAERREERRKQGICTKCGKHKARSNRSSCEWCLAKARNNYNKKKADISRFERSSYGYCYLCGDDLDRDGKTCSKCSGKLLSNFKGIRPNNETWKEDNRLIFLRR